MSEHRFAILDPAAGISGDMTLGALLDVGASEAWLQSLPDRLGLSGIEIGVEDTMRCGVRAKKVDVWLHGATEQPGDVPETGFHHGAPDPIRPDRHPHSGSHGVDHVPHGHHAHTPHHHVTELLELIETAPLSPWVKNRAQAAFRLLAQVEGAVHGLTPEEVALHEVGAYDALIDIVGSVEGFEQLGVTEVYSRPTVLGNGWVRAAEGVLPIPAPATIRLIEGIAVGPDGPVTGEATTPTGAALLRVLSQGSPQGAWRTVKSGWGAGGRNPAGYPNVLKLIIAEPVREAAAVVLLAADLDDLSPDHLEPLTEGLAAAGALDVRSWTTHAKQGRAGWRVEAVAVADRATAVIETFFRHSPTAQVRQTPAERHTMHRRVEERFPTAGDAVRTNPSSEASASRVTPEFEDVIAAARRSGYPALDLAAEPTHQALRRVRPEEGSDHEAKE